MTKLSVVGLDLAKNVFQVHGIDADGEVIVHKQLRRQVMFPYATFSNKDVYKAPLVVKRYCRIGG